jgi:hypothetical protein
LSLFQHSSQNIGNLSLVFSQKYVPDLLICLPNGVRLPKFVAIGNIPVKGVIQYGVSFPKQVTSLPKKCGSIQIMLSRLIRLVASGQKIVAVLPNKWPVFPNLQTGGAGV